MPLKLNGTNTVSEPAFTGDDTDTGLQCGTNELKLVTGGTARATVDSDGALDVPTDFPIKVNGTEKLRIDSSGQVGIGNNSPDSLLHLKNSSNFGIRLTKTASSDAEIKNTNSFIPASIHSSKI